MKNNFYDKSIEQYFKNISKIKPLTKEEEKVLFQKVKNGDIEARNKIIEANLKYVVKMAKKYRGHGVSFNDLISEGNLGLLKAMDKFDEKNDVKFYCYGIWWIRASLQNCIKENDTSCEQEVKYEDILDISEKSTIDSQKFMEYNDNEDKIKKEKKEEKALCSVLSSLTNEEKNIIGKYYGLFNKVKKYTLQDLSKELGISMERVRQKKEIAMRKMRSFAIENSIKTNIY